MIRLLSDRGVIPHDTSLLRRGFSIFQAQRRRKPAISGHPTRPQSVLITICSWEKAVENKIHAERLLGMSSWRSLREWAGFGEQSGETRQEAESVRGLSQRIMRTGIGSSRTMFHRVEERDLLMV